MRDDSGSSEQMRDRILAAGLEEFAAYGLAGARVDRIAATASVNKNSIYRYFPGKDELFAAVLHRHMERVLTDVPFSPDDLPGFAMRLFDYALDRPQLMRLVTWSGLERPTPGKKVDSMGDKFAAIRELQEAGRLAADVPPTVIFTVITAIGTAWSAVNPFTALIDPSATDDREALRGVIGRLVERAFAPSSGSDQP